MAKSEMEFNFWPFDAIRYRKAKEKLDRDLERHGNSIREAGAELKVFKELIIDQDGISYSLHFSAQNVGNVRVLRIDHRKTSQSQGKWGLTIIRSELEFKGAVITAIRTGNISVDNLDFGVLDGISPKLNSLDGLGKQATTISSFADSVFALIDYRPDALMKVFTDRTK